MEQLDFSEIGLHCGKGIINQISILVRACAGTNNLPVEKVYQNTDVVPFVVYSNVGQVAYDGCVLDLTIKLPIKYIGNRRLVTFTMMYFETAF